MKSSALRSMMLLCLQATALVAVAQRDYTHADSLRGSNTRFRSWWDAVHYQLSVQFNETDSTVRGFNTITYRVLRRDSVMQIDLQRPLVADSILDEAGRRCTWRVDGHALMVRLLQSNDSGLHTLSVYYHGKPRIAKQPPWDGGLVWQQDRRGNPWISAACQGIGASVWYPVKDIQSDEVDSALIRLSVPADLVAVSNGRLRSVSREGKFAVFTWAVRNPINNYNIIPYIGRYVNFKDTLAGEGGILDLDYWVLEDNLQRARQQFSQVKPMLHCFESWFGPYPFYADGYKLVDAPYLGMEHQSAVAYGNGYQNGYKGRDLSLTGWGMRWDFIIVHESGHEWFANSITAADVADNWIHEGFTSYSENLFTECLFGKEAGAEYVIGTRNAVLNDKPVIGSYGVNAEGSGDMYYKGENMLHTIRYMVNNDSLWRAFLRAINRQFRHSVVTTAQVEAFMSDFLHIDLQPIFNQYLRSTRIPVLEYRISGRKLSCRWTNSVDGFNMPLRIGTGKNQRLIQPTTEWTTPPWRSTRFDIPPDYYILSKKIN